MEFDFNTVKDILVCPKSKTELVHDGDALVCRDADCRLRYEIQDEIPIMLVDDATELSPEDWGEVMARRRNFSG